MSTLPDLIVGGLFGPHRLDARLGGGSFGSVWRATDTRTGTTVALKILTGAYSVEEAAGLRADIELLAAGAAGESEHVVRVLGGGPDPAPHVVMEYLDGRDLAAELAEKGPMDEAEALRIGEAVADALSALARVGIVHRDVKPSNIMLLRGGGVKLADFGIAKIAGFDTLTRTGQVPLTMAYAAPEVWDGQAGPSSDLYALGIVLFQCLAGRLPFAGSYTDVYRAHLTRVPDLGLLPAGTAPSLVALISACLAKESAGRPATADACLAELATVRAELAARDAAGPARPPSALGPWRLLAPHPQRPWAWGARDEESGARAIVEVCFGADLDLGSQIHRAVEANSALVPLGAERLLGLNRLMLRPGEAWPVPPPAGPFAFWVAREELPTPIPAPLDRAAVARALEGVDALRAAALAAGVRLDLGPSALVVLPGGDIHVRRPGLPPDGQAVPDDSVLATFLSLPLDPTAQSEIAAADLGDLRSRLGVPSPGTAGSGVPDAHDGTVRIEGGIPDRAVPGTAVPALASGRPGDPPQPPGSGRALGTEPRVRRRAGYLGLAAVGLALALVAVSLAFAARGGGPGASGSPQAGSGVSDSQAAVDRPAGGSHSAGASGLPSAQATPTDQGSGSSESAPSTSGSSDSQAILPATPSVGPVTTATPSGVASPIARPSGTAHPTPTPAVTAPRRQGQRRRPRSQPPPTPTPNPHPNLIVSTDPAVSSDGVGHGASQPYIVASGAIFNNVTIDAGAYMSASGTTLSFIATGVLTVDGVITMDGRGYAGGSGGAGHQGNSYPGTHTGQTSSAANGGGGGGGGDNDCGGGGGGYGTGGEAGHYTASCQPGVRAAGGSTYGDSSLSTLYLGSGGGASWNAVCDSGCPYANGGAGGGVINITASSIAVNGSIEANGAAGQSLAQTPNGGALTGYHGGGGRQRRQHPADRRVPHRVEQRHGPRRGGGAWLLAQRRLQRRRRRPGQIPVREVIEDPRP
ncbi:MAG: serine/threonine-protein kinase [Candidatus Limnocylindrales bacterium]